MSNPADRRIPNDEELVAYLDGELPADERSRLAAILAADAGARARLDRLARGGREFAAAFDRLFDNAPADRLAAMLQGLAAESRAKQRAVAARGSWRPALIAAGIALFIFGGAAGYLAGAAGWMEQDEASAPGYWREVVAEYVALYTTDTFAGFPDDTAIHSVALAGVGSKIGLDLTPEKVALPGLALKGAILFTFHDKPLAQVAYLSPQYGPVAFCMIVNGQPDRPPSFEVREGRNIVYWEKGGRGYLVIGSAPRGELEAYAARLDSKVS